MTSAHAVIEQRWEASFEEQIARQAYNTAPVEALVRSIAYYLRDRFGSADLRKLHFLEMGCGAAPNLVWLARKGITVSGVDIAPTALRLARATLTEAGCGDRVGALVEAPVSQLPFLDRSFDGIIEACVFQHLDLGDRLSAFAEVRRLLKPGGLFVGYMLADSHTVYRQRHAEESSADRGTLDLADGGSRFHLTNIGPSHFYAKDELVDLLEGFSVVDPCLTTYEIPRDEAARRGYAHYVQAMWTVYAVK